MVRSCVASLMIVLLAFTVFGQDLEFFSIEKLPATVNTAAEESCPLLSPDGKLFFARALYYGNEGGEFAGQDVWVAERYGNTWNRASNNLGLINNRNNNVVIGFRKKDGKMYFTDGSPYQQMDGIYMTSAKPSRKEKATTVRIPGLENQDFIGFYVSPDEDVIFLSMKGPGSNGNEDLYYSVKDATGQWTKPRTLGTTINTNGFEISPFLSADKKRLYFASNGHGGEGDADIFYSEKLYDSWETWSVPVNLGPAINSKKFDAYFSIYGDSIAFFASNREGKLADIYSARVGKTKTILAKNQRYLSAGEWERLVGQKVSSKFEFANQSSVLTQGQKELLFYIVNKLMLERDINFHLVVTEEEQGKKSQERLDAVSKELKRQGIDGGRIITEQVAKAAHTSRGVIELRLFR